MEVTITLNGDQRRVPAGSVGELLSHLGLQPGMVVVELNREIVGREALDRTEVREGDQMELVHFVGGG